LLAVAVGSGAAEDDADPSHEGSWRSCHCSFSLSGGGELEEHFLQAGALGGPQLGEGDPRFQCCLADECGVRVGARGAVASWVRGESPHIQGPLKAG
jgi:hypothetical protein